MSNLNLSCCATDRKTPSVSSLQLGQPLSGGGSNFYLKKESSDCLGRMVSDSPSGTPRHGSATNDKRRGSLGILFPSQSGLSQAPSVISEAEEVDQKTPRGSIDSVDSEIHEGPDWAIECLKLTHEPIRSDLTVMESAAQRIARDEKPEEWRVRCCASVPPPQSLTVALGPEQVRCFFRFFDDFCSLVSQFVRARLEPWARSPAAFCAHA